MKRPFALLWMLGACVPEAIEPLANDLTQTGGLPADELEDLAPIDVVVIEPGAPKASFAEEAMVANAAQATVVYLNREGRTYTAGNDDAARGTSSVLRYQGVSQVNFPAAGYSEAQWQELVSRVRYYFNPFEVQIVTERPATPGYLEVAIGNTSASIMRLSNNVGGISPLRPCAITPRSVAYVFHTLYDRGYGGILGAAEATAHEIGHSLSLSHESLQTDLMSYAPTNPNKNFQDQASYCGTSPRSESCSCGGITQNSHQQLIQMVGARATEPVPEPEPQDDNTPPVVAIVTPDDGQTFAAGSRIDVVVEASDETTLSQVQLFWEFTNRLLDCTNDVASITCQRSGNRTVWTLHVGEGERRFYAVATDAAGNRAQTETRVLQFENSSAPAPGELRLTAVRPLDNELISRGGQVVFQAQVESSSSIREVRATWRYGSGSVDYVLRETQTPGLYQATTSMSRNGQVGTRTVTLQATDDNGQVVRSAPITVNIR